MCNWIDAKEQQPNSRPHWTDSGMLAGLEVLILQRGWLTFEVGFAIWIPRFYLETYNRGDFYLDDYNAENGAFYLREGWYSTGEMYGGPFPDVTHWMPLPALPEGLTFLTGKLPKGIQPKLRR